MPSVSLALDRTVFGSGELHGVSAPATTEFADCCYLILDGFTRAQITPVPSFAMSLVNYTGADQAATTANFQAVYGALQESDPSLPSSAVQRFTLPINLRMNLSAFDLLNNSVTSFDVQFAATIAGAPYTAASTGASFQLFFQQNPFLLDGPVAYMSPDVRVFRVRRGGSVLSAPPAGTPAAWNTFAAGDTPHGFIQRLIGTTAAPTGSLNDPAQNGNYTPNQPATYPAAVRWFEALPTDQMAAALTHNQQEAGQDVYNFAIARVRYADEAQLASAMQVFFRLYSTSSPAVTYLSQGALGATSAPGAYAWSTPAVPGGIRVPDPGYIGSAISTFPSFAVPRNPAGATAASSPVDTEYNRRQLDGVGAGSLGAERSTFFGVWLDFNWDGVSRYAPVLGGVATTLNNLLVGAHHCLVAEIQFDGDVIPDNATPGTSDNIAWRNIHFIP